jgi:death-on-curing protein
MDQKEEIACFGETEIVAIHDMLLHAFGGESGVRDQDLLKFICKAPHLDIFGRELYPTPYDKAAKYAFSFAEYQIFVDGNKRTGIVTALAYLKDCGIQLLLTQEECYNLAMDIAAGHYAECSDISTFFRNFPFATICDEPHIPQKADFEEDVDSIIRQYGDALQWLAEGEPDRNSEHVKQYERHVKETFGEGNDAERD